MTANNVTGDSSVNSSDVESEKIGNCTETRLEEKKNRPANGDVFNSYKTKRLTVKHIHLLQ